MIIHSKYCAILNTKNTTLLTNFRVTNHKQIDVLFLCNRFFVY